MELKKFSIVLCFLTVVHSDDPPLIKTSSGTVQGYWAKSFDGRQYAAFEGIPYAEKPVGKLRFEEPRTVKKWPGVWMANTIYKCPQTTLDLSSAPFGDEDCLYLNIYVPKINSSNKLDVVVHIHGGGLMAGYGSEYTGARYVIDRNVVFITLQYRLGVLGFLSTEDDIVPGNMGMKDQVAALKWVKKNIKYFNGNPNSVTLTGFSAGSAAMHFHYFSPLSRGLFHRGMSFSGTSLNSWALQEKALFRAQTIGIALGCPTNTNKILVECLKTRPASSIVNVTIQTQYQYAPFPGVPFALVVEQGGPKPFLPEHPYRLLQKKKVYDVPWITSSTSHDGYINSLFLASRLEDLNANWNCRSKYFVDDVFTAPPNLAVDIADDIRKFYFGDEDIDLSTFQSLTQLLTDRAIRIDGQLAAYLQSNVSNSSIYYYTFSYEGANSLKNLFGASSFPGAAHGDDVIYFLGGGVLITAPFTESDIRMKNIALDTLYSYAHTGVPTISNVTWNPIGDEFVYLNIAGPADIEMKTKTNYTADEFWHGLGLLENANLFPSN